jgi:hypothetical protein
MDYSRRDRREVARLEKESDDYFRKLVMFQLPDEVLSALMLGAKGVVVAAALGERGKWHYAIRLDGFDEVLLSSVPYPAIAGLMRRFGWSQHQCSVDGVSTVVWTNKGDVKVDVLCNENFNFDVKVKVPW